MSYKKWMPLAVVAGGLCAVPLGMRTIKPSRNVSPQDAAPARPAPALSARSAAGSSPKADCRRAEQARERAVDGIGRVERTVSDKKMVARSAAAFRAQMAPRLVAAGADRQVVERWLRQTVRPQVAAQSRTTAADAAPDMPAPDFSQLTPEEREVIGMNANFIHASSLNHQL